MSARRVPAARRLFTTAPRSRPAPGLDALDKWIASEKTLTIPDTLHPEHVSDLFITLPTRDGTRAASIPPKRGDPLGYGHHLAFFHPRNPESVLRWDGTDADFCPPEPFMRRMWAGGKMTWKGEGNSRLRIGDRVQAVSEMRVVKRKGFDKGTPMVFVQQRIEFTKEGSDEVAIEEERSHVYLAAPANRRTVKQVTGMPPPAFSFQYLPTPTTLFRFSALTFNGHYIHLDKDYAHSEGYSERLVHGPLTALMLLDTTAFFHPDVAFRSFEYRALNPLVVNRAVTIHGARESTGEAGKEKAFLVWAVDPDDVVVMSGRITV